MFRISLIFVLILSAFAVCFAQENKILVKAGTEVSIQNETVIDAGKLKVGDDLNFKLTQEIKGEGGSISAGSEIFGRVVEVEKASNTNNASRVIMIFDFVKNGEDFLMLKAVILSIQGVTDVKIETSEIYQNGTILTSNGKNLLIESGKEFRAKLTEDMGAG